MNSIAFFCSYPHDQTLCLRIPFPEVPELRKSCLDREISPPPGIRSRQPEEVQITYFISSQTRVTSEAINLIFACKIL